MSNLAMKVARDERCPMQDGTSNAEQLPHQAASAAFGLPGSRPSLRLAAMTAVWPLEPQQPHTDSATASSIPASTPQAAEPPAAEPSEHSLLIAHAGAGPPAAAHASHAPKVPGVHGSNSSTERHGNASRHAVDVSQHAARNATASSFTGPPSSRSVAPSLPAAAVPAPIGLPIAAGTAAQVAAIGVPDRCIIAGSALFSSCSVEISAAQAHFNITVPFLAPQNYTRLLQERGVTRGQVLQYLRQALAQPSSRCCAAACCFNQLLLCDCEPSVLQVVVRFAGADEAFYALLTAQLARSCGSQFFYGLSCPANATVSYSAATCVGGATLPMQDPGGALKPPPGTNNASPADGNVAPPVCMRAARLDVTNADDQITAGSGGK